MLGGILLAFKFELCFPLCGQHVAVGLLVFLEELSPSSLGLLGPYSLRSRKQRLQSPSVHKEDPAPRSREHPRTNDWVQVDGGPLASLGHVFATMEKGDASHMREGAINIHKQIGSKRDDKVVSTALGTTLFSSRSPYLSACH